MILIMCFCTRCAGIFSLEGESLRENRRFILHKLRDFGLGQTSYDAHINAEVSDLCEVLLQQGEQPYDVSNALTQSLLANMTHILFGCSNSDKKEVDFLLHELSLLTEFPPGILLLNASALMTSLW